VKRVLIAVSAAVLAAGVEGLLNRTGGFEVIRILPSEADTLQREVDRVRPTVLIVDQGVPLGDLAPMLENAKSPDRFRILVVHPEHNALQVFDRREVELQSGLDLIQLLQAQ
jgi:DNA-binding NarL/FixJ family response regulator